jgi:hypothetical protein
VSYVICHMSYRDGMGMVLIGRCHIDWLGLIGGCHIERVGLNKV